MSTNANPSSAAERCPSNPRANLPSSTAGFRHSTRLARSLSHRPSSTATNTVLLISLKKLRPHSQASHPAITLKLPTITAKHRPIINPSPSLSESHQTHRLHIETRKIRKRASKIHHFPLPTERRAIPAPQSLSPLTTLRCTLFNHPRRHSTIATHPSLFPNRLQPPLPPHSSSVAQIQRRPTARSCISCMVPHSFPAGIRAILEPSSRPCHDAERCFGAQRGVARDLRTERPSPNTSPLLNVATIAPSRSPPRFALGR